MCWKLRVQPTQVSYCLPCTWTIVDLKRNALLLALFVYKQTLWYLISLGSLDGSRCCVPGAQRPRSAQEGTHRFVNSPSWTLTCVARKIKFKSSPFPSFSHLNPPSPPLLSLPFFPSCYESKSDGDEHILPNLSSFSDGLVRRWGVGRVRELSRENARKGWRVFLVCGLPPLVFHLKSGILCVNSCLKYWQIRVFSA